MHVCFPLRCLNTRDYKIIARDSNQLIRNQSHCVIVLTHYKENNVFRFHNKLINLSTQYIDFVVKHVEKNSNYVKRRF